MSTICPAWQSADEEADTAAADQRALHARVKNASNPSLPPPFVAPAALLEREGNANPMPGPVPAMPALPVVWEQHPAPARAPAHVAPPRAPSNPPPPPPYDAPVGVLAQLLDMGFSREQALWALTSENGNLEAATNLLLAAASD